MITLSIIKEAGTVLLQGKSGYFHLITIRKGKVIQGDMCMRLSVCECVHVFAFVYVCVCLCVFVCICACVHLVFVMGFKSQLTLCDIIARSAHSIVLSGLQLPDDLIYWGGEKLLTSCFIFFIN